MDTPVIAVIDTGICNLRSVTKGLEKVGANIRIAETPEDIASANASGLVLPGVGALTDCVAVLKDRKFDALIRNWIHADKPFLGVCLGMQALFEYSEEGISGRTEGLGIFPGKVLRFRLPAEYKIPHMGWNTIRFVQKNSPLQEGLREDGEAFYFVHSFHCVPKDESLILADCDYGGRFTAAIAKGNCFATQFHPEKSQAKGLEIYHNFAKLVASGKNRLP